MEKVKFGALIAALICGAIWYGLFIRNSDNYFRALMVPEKVEEAEASGSPVFGQKVPVSTIKPPVGSAWDDDWFDLEAPFLIITKRRATMSDIKTVFYYSPDPCLKCHEEEGPGVFFYGKEDYMKYVPMKTPDGLLLHSHTEKKDTPTVKYIYKDRHLKKVPFDIGAPLEIYMARGL
ncbi:MAG: hypothetical protein HY751_01000 [Nitrospinae bacterium]|nr:hypothetical protein [Nitrospinota bacterium]